MNPSVVEQLLELAGKTAEVRERAERALATKQGPNGDMGDLAALNTIQGLARDVVTLLAAVNLVEPLARDWQRLKRIEEEARLLAFAMTDEEAATVGYLQTVRKLRAALELKETPE